MRMSQEFQQINHIHSSVSHLFKNAAQSSTQWPAASQKTNLAVLHNHLPGWCMSHMVYSDIGL